MKRVLVYKGDAERGLEWRDILARDAPDLEFRIWPDIGDPATVVFDPWRVRPGVRIASAWDVLAAPAARKKARPR